MPITAPSFSHDMSDAAAGVHSFGLTALLIIQCYYEASLNIRYMYNIIILVLTIQI